MRKVVWITVLNKERNEAAAKKLYQMVSQYGLSAAGHFWRDENEKMAWSSAREDLVKKETGLWILLGAPDDFAVESVRFGLSMLALGVLDQRGHGFPIMIALTDGDLDPARLPTAFRGADVFKADNPALGAKIVAKANMPIKKTPADYHLDTYGIEGVGQWFEVGPAEGGNWSGAMFGVDQGEINAHGVGPSHKLPERAVLNYPMQGMKLNLGDREFTAWAVQNELTGSDSYYLRVVDFPDTIIFGPLSQGDDAEVFVVDLK